MGCVTKLSTCIAQVEKGEKIKQKKFLHHNLICSCHNILTISVTWRSNNIIIPVSSLTSQLLALVRQFTIGKVLIIECKLPRSSRRRCRLKLTIMDTLVYEIRCGFVVCVQRHKGRCRIDSFTTQIIVWINYEMNKIIKRKSWDPCTKK